MLRPAKSEFQREHNAVHLTFPDGTDDKYYVRGAIVFPQANYGGFCIVAAQDLRDRVVRIYEEKAFLGVTVTEIIKDSTNKIIDKIDRGITAFLNEMAEKYRCYAFFYDKKQETAKHWRKQIYREDLIDPRPRLIGIELPETREGRDNLIMSYSWKDRLKIDQETQLFQMLPSIQEPADERKTAIFPEAAQSLEALRVLLAGLEKIPWRRPEDNEEEWYN